MKLLLAEDDGIAWLLDRMAELKSAIPERGSLSANAKRTASL
jgi:hypothetical protein